MTDDDREIDFFTPCACAQGNYNYAVMSNLDPFLVRGTHTVEVWKNNDEGDACSGSAEETMVTGMHAVEVHAAEAMVRPEGILAVEAMVRNTYAVEALVKGYLQSDFTGGGVGDSDNVQYTDLCCC